MAGRVVAVGDFMCLRAVIEAGGGEWKSSTEDDLLSFFALPVLEDRNLAHDEVMVGEARRRPYTYDDLVDLVAGAGR